MSGLNKFYRYHSVEYAILNINGDFVSPSFPNPKIELREFDLVKETSKGYWIDNGKWISKTSKKRYAYPTKQEALNNFITRTEYRIKILSRQLDSCKISVNIAKNLHNSI